MQRLLTALSLFLAAACAAAPPELASPATHVGPPTAMLPATETQPLAAAPGSLASTLSATAARPPIATPFVGQIAIPRATVRYYTTVRCYMIEGASAAELRAEMDANGLVDEAGDRGDALTKWYVSWHWPGWGRRDCDLLAAKVAYIISVFVLC